MLRCSCKQWISQDRKGTATLLLCPLTARLYWWASTALGDLQTLNLKPPNRPFSSRLGFCLIPHCWRDKPSFLLYATFLEGPGSSLQLISLYSVPLSTHRQLCCCFVAACCILMLRWCVLAAVICSFLLQSCCCLLWFYLPRCSILWFAAALCILLLPCCSV